MYYRKFQCLSYHFITFSPTNVFLFVITIDKLVQDSNHHHLFYPTNVFFFFTNNWQISSRFMKEQIRASRNFEHRRCMSALDKFVRFLLWLTATLAAMHAMNYQWHSIYRFFQLLSIKSTVWNQKSIDLKSIWSGNFVINNKFGTCTVCSNAFLR